MNEESHASRQLAELEALKAVFPEPGAVVLDHEQAANPADTLPTLPSTLGGTVLLQNSQLAARPTGLRFRLPGAYPEEPPDIQVLCEAGRSAHDALTAAVARCIAANQGTEVLLLAIQEIEELVEELQSQQNLAGQIGGSFEEAQDRTVDLQSNLVGRKAIWFHHIKSLTKRKNILNWAQELDVRGFSKPGFPGVIICEGIADNVDEYTHRIRAMRWQAMSVRAEEADDHDTAQAEPQWHFTEPFQELGEGDLDVLSSKCRAAGLDYLFKAVMKL